MNKIYKNKLSSVLGRKPTKGWDGGSMGNPPRIRGQQALREGGHDLNSDPRGGESLTHGYRGRQTTPYVASGRKGLGLISTAMGRF